MIVNNVKSGGVTISPLQVLVSLSFLISQIENISM